VNKMNKELNKKPFVIITNPFTGKKMKLSGLSVNEIKLYLEYDENQFCLLKDSISRWKKLLRVSLKRINKKENKK